MLQRSSFDAFNVKQAGLRMERYIITSQERKEVRWAKDYELLSGPSRGRTYDQSGRVDNRGVTLTRLQLFSLRTVHAPFSAHGSPGIRFIFPELSYLTVHRWYY